MANTKNIGLNLNPEILIQPAASGKHIAKVFETPKAKNGAVIIPRIISPYDLICRLNNLSLIALIFVSCKLLIDFSIQR